LGDVQHVILQAIFCYQDALGWRLVSPETARLCPPSGGYVKRCLQRTFRRGIRSGYAVLATTVVLTVLAWLYVFPA
jgi:hypothetical protein